MTAAHGRARARLREERGWESLRRAVLAVLPVPVPVSSPAPVRVPVPAAAVGRLLAESALTDDRGHPSYGDRDLAVSSEESSTERERLIALVELARGGDRDAFGELYDHYHLSVYRFLLYRTRSATLAEDLTADTFFRALRSMDGFRWQGRDFGAWLMTIARNLTIDHFKSGRARLESASEDMTRHDGAGQDVESAVMAGATAQMLAEAMTDLPGEQHECLLLRFVEELSIAETAEVLGRSEGAVKQLQLRAVRNLAKLVPEGVRDR